MDACRGPHGSTVTLFRPLLPAGLRRWYAASGGARIRIGHPRLQARLAAGFPLFEIDQAKVLEFKEAVLNRAEATSTCERHLVPVDLRADWASALGDKGFDPSLPTAWLAEGLLPYLPAEAEEKLLSTIHSLSAPGSHIAIEQIRDMHALFDEPMLERASNQFGIDIRALVHDDDRADPDTVLASYGWTTTIDTVKDVASDYNREPSSTAGLFAGQSRFVTASLPS